MILFFIGYYLGCMISSLVISIGEYNDRKSTILLFIFAGFLMPVFLLVFVIRIFKDDFARIKKPVYYGSIEKKTEDV